MPSDVERRSSERRWRAGNCEATIRDGNRASDVVTRLRALFSKKEATKDVGVGFQQGAAGFTPMD